MNKTILIADDDINVLAGLNFLLSEEGYNVLQAHSPSEVFHIVNKHTIDLLLTDMNFEQDTTSGQEGLTLIKTLQQSESQLPIIVMTGWASIDIAVAALKAGAKDFIQKPWKDERLLSLIQTQLKLAVAEKKAANLQQQNNLLSQCNHPTADSGIIANSRVMQDLLEQLKVLAQSDMNILLTGDNGTGKSMLARYIHQASQRAHNPFVSINMGAISENLFESEMFGHTKGAFTDAKESRIGRFEMAENGSLFLDELANIPLSQQAKLLHVLEERKFESVGSNKTLEANVRIISATNANLNQMIAKAEFRQDLYYRLNTVELKVPSLSERQQDIIPLAEYFLTQFSQKYHKKTAQLSEGAIQALLAYAWPGNIRELSHLMERVLFTCQKQLIKSQDLKLVIPINADDNSNLNANPQLNSSETRDPLLTSTLTLNQVEECILKQRLVQFEGNVTETARSLGLSRSGYYRRVHKHALD